MSNIPTLWKQILVAGSVAYDEIMDFPGEFQAHFHPEHLHQINVSFVVDNLEKQLGGTATNIAYNIRLVNSHVVVELLSAIGKDGAQFIDFFNKHNIGTLVLKKDSKLFTSTGKVITDMNDNQIWGFYYGASVRASEIRLDRLKSGSLLVLSACHLKAFLHFQHEAIRLKIPYMYDPGMLLTRLTPKQLKEGVAHSAILIGNDYEVASIESVLQTSVEQIAEKGVLVIKTLGREGAMVYDRLQSYTIPAILVKKTVDPTGAGDAFRGGFLSAYSRGGSVHECVVLGNVLASFAVEKYGTIHHKPRKSEVERRKKEILKKIKLNGT